MASNTQLNNKHKFSLFDLVIIVLSPVGGINLS